MENVPVIVGLDYHRSSVRVCVVDASGRVLVNRSCGNSVLEVASAIGPGREVRRVAIESGCGAADLAEVLIRDLAWPVTLAHSRYVAAGGRDRVS